MEKALKHCGGKAFIFSNELVDAFPARVFEYTEQGWQEVGLTVKDGAIREELRPVLQKPLFSHMLEYDSQPGQRIETMIPTPSGSPHGFPCGVRAP